MISGDPAVCSSTETQPGRPGRADPTRTEAPPGAQRTWTGRDLDVAIEGRGYMVVRAPDGGEAYSRAGNLNVNSAGQLTDMRGRPVLGRTGPIELPLYDTIRIGADGSIYIGTGLMPGGVGELVDWIRLANPDPDSLFRGPDGLLRQRDGAAAVVDEDVRLASGYLETIDRDRNGSMALMIRLQRDFESYVEELAIHEHDDAPDWLAW